MAMHGNSAHELELLENPRKVDRRKGILNHVMEPILMTNATRRSLGANMHEQLSTGPSSWAVKMLQKHGWEK